MSHLLELVGRKHELFAQDVAKHEEELSQKIALSSFLVIGGAGSIGQAVVKEIFKRKPLKLHVVDISENNLTELVRDIRSSFGYIDGVFSSFALDVGSKEYDAFINSDGQYDYVLNLSALKHVRSEKDPYTLMRMVDTNIFNTNKTIKQSIENGVKKYFCVSTDKASNPVNLMGCSKRIMEMYLMRSSLEINISTARFANVAFSDGSLLYSFNKRIEKLQPIAAPNDIKRYFISAKEGGELCLLSCIFGENRDIFFPKLNEDLDLVSFAEIASKFLLSKGYKPYLCSTEKEARDLSKSLPKKGEWPCFFSGTNTTGEKAFEEFYSANELLDMKKFSNLGVIKNQPEFNQDYLNKFEISLNKLRDRGSWTKSEIIEQFYLLMPDFKYDDVGNYLDGKM